jgi:hypothetical protein
LLKQGETGRNRAKKDLILQTDRLRKKRKIESVKLKTGVDYFSKLLNSILIKVSSCTNNGSYLHEIF